MMTNLNQLTGKDWKEISHGYEFKLPNERMNKGMITEFKPVPKNMKELSQILTFKNDKISNEFKEHHISFEKLSNENNSYQINGVIERISEMGDELKINREERVNISENEENENSEINGIIYEKTYFNVPSSTTTINSQPESEDIAFVKLKSIIKREKLISKESFNNYEKLFEFFKNQIITKTYHQQNLIDTYLHESIDRYYFKYFSHEYRLETYVNIRVKTIIFMGEENINTFEFNESEERFWAKCLMTFFSQNVNQLQEVLKNEGHEYLITTLNNFFTHKEIENEQEIKQKPLFSHCFFYQIFAKILFNEELSETEEKQLYPEEKNILIVLKLIYAHEKSWVSKCLCILEQFVDEMKGEKSNFTLFIVLEILSCCQKEFEKTEFEEIVEYFLTFDHNLLKQFFNGSINCEKVITEKFSLNKDFLEKIFNHFIKSQD